MKSIIQGVYFGEGRGDNIEENSEYNRLIKENIKLQNYLEQSLPEEHLSSFRLFSDICSGMEYEAGYARYNAGFKDGFLLALEILSEK